MNISPVHCEGLNCFEDIIVTMASHYNIEYRLAFSDTWGFEYKSLGGTSSRLLGERIGNDVNNVNSLLYKYCNLNIIRFDGQPMELLAITKKYLAQKIPVGLFLDAYWCPWLQGRYQKIHDLHHCLIIGMDDNDKLYCLDPAINMSICTLYYNDFINGCKNCVIFEFNKNVLQPNYLKILNESVDNLINKKFYYRIKNFANDFRDSFDISAEYANYNLDVWYVLIDRNLRLIASGRTLYSEFIDLMSEKLQSDELLSVKNELLKVASNWNKIRGILTKSYRKGYSDNVKEKVYTLLYGISNFEEELVSKLYHIVKNNLFESNKNDLLNINDKNKFLDTKIVPLNLDDIFNNRAFASSETDTYKADLTSTGLFFISDNLANEGSLHVNGMYFRLPELIIKQYDNIACSGQIITVDKSIYHSIMFLGCSDNGDFIDDVSIFYENGEELKIPISFTDSWRLPKFNESIAWTGKGGRWTENRMDVHLNEQRIFAREEIIKKRGIIESIRLPDCPNIHIFSISLRKLI